VEFSLNYNPEIILPIIKSFLYGPLTYLSYYEKDKLYIDYKNSNLLNYFFDKHVDVFENSELNQGFRELADLYTSYIQDNFESGHITFHKEMIKSLDLYCLEHKFDIINILNKKF